MGHRAVSKELTDCICTRKLRVLHDWHITEAISLSLSVVLVRERTIQTKRSPLVGDVSANFCG
jgi:hypothetical protein